MTNKTFFTRLTIGITLFFGIVFGAQAINISVPSSPGAGYWLISTTTGAYISTTTSPIMVGSVNATSPTATSTFANGVNTTGGCLAQNGTCLTSSLIGGSGTPNTIPKFTASGTIGDSSMTDNGTVVAGTLPLKLPAGAVGAPSLYLSTDSTTGFYRPALNQLAVSVSGVLKGLWDTNGLTISPNGIDSYKLTFDGGTADYTLYSDDTGVVGRSDFRIQRDGANLFAVGQGSTGDGTTGIGLDVGANTSGVINLISSSGGIKTLTFRINGSDIFNVRSDGVLIATSEIRAGGTQYTESAIVFNSTSPSFNQTAGGTLAVGRLGLTNFIRLNGTVLGDGGSDISIGAKINLKAGNTVLAPLLWTSGTLLTTPIAGTQEFLTDKWYGTITTGAARKEFTLNDIALTSGRVPFATTNGRLTDSGNLVFNGTNFGIGTSSPYAKLTVWGNGTTASTTLEVVNSASTTLARILDSGVIQFGTTTTAQLNLGTTNSTNGTSTIQMGKIQWDGYDSSGARICAYFVSTTLTAQLGACTQ